MLRSLILQRNFNSSIKLCRTYLTQEFKNVMDQDVPLENINKNVIDEMHVNKRTSAVRTDYMARTMSTKEESRQDMMEELAKLRNQSDAIEIIRSTGHYVIKNFIRAEAIPELLDILKHKLKYGVFVEKYSGSYLMDALLEKKLYLEACQVAVEHYLQDDYDSELICALALKAGYEALKAKLISTIKSAEEPESKEVIKVRVKYVRNPNPFDKTDDLKHMIGLTLLKMSKIAPEDIKKNMEIPGLILTSKFDEALTILNSKKDFDKDILLVSLELVKDIPDVSADLVDALETLSKTSSSYLSEKVDTVLNEAIKKEEPLIIAEQKENYKLWSKQLTDKLEDAIAHRTKLLRLKNIEEIMDEIKTKKKLLWYFEMEDKVDLEIYRKFKYHPKKWFGKKKKPRVVDENYIPPELR